MTREKMSSTASDVALELHYKFLGIEEGMNKTKKIPF